MSWWRRYISQLRERAKGMSREQIEARGRPYQLILRDPAGVVWMLVREARLADALEAVRGRVQPGWTVEVDGVVIAEGRDPVIGDYLSSLARVRRAGGGDDDGA